MSDANGNPIPNVSEATKFLLELQEGDVYVFTLEGGMRAQKCSRDPKRIALAIEAATKLKQDVYYHPATTNANWSGAKTPGKHHVTDSMWVWCDIDPRAQEPFDEERQRIATLPWPNGVPPATITVFSGGGRQFLWKLSEPVQEKECESILRWIVSKFPDADRARSNINSLLRVPGTINWPGAGKIAKNPGRVPMTACIVDENRTRVYAPDAFGRLDPSAEAPSIVPITIDEERVPAKVDIKELPEKIRKLVMTPHAVTERSEPLWHALCEMQRHRIAPETALAIILDRELPISSSIYTASTGKARRDPRRHAERQIARAYAQAAAEGAVFTVHEHIERARAFRSIKYPDLGRFRGEFVDYKNGQYAAVESEKIDSEIWRFLERSKKKVKVGEVWRTEPFRPNTKLVTETKNALKAIAQISDPGKVPFWVDGDGDLDPREIISFPNGLLHLQSGEFYSPDTSFFTYNALPFEYDPDAPKPERWIWFVNKVFEHDPKQADLLQEIFGYILVPDTSLQKGFNIVGPTRSGKGIIGRTLRKLVGPLNTCAPKLKDLGTGSFPLEPYIGKQLALVSDLRVSKKADKESIVEHLLNVIGEDPVDVKRKYNPQAWHGILSTRFVLLSNEQLSLPDNSGALAGRLIFLETPESYLNREDLTLEPAFEREMSGIVNWAVEGWRRLNGRTPRRFDETQFSVDARSDMHDRGSPIAAFVKDWCVVEAEALSDKDEMYDAFLLYQSKNRTNWYGSKNHFAAELYTVCQARSVRPRSGNEDRKPMFKGVRLRQPVTQPEPEQLI